MHEITRAPASSRVEIIGPVADYYVREFAQIGRENEAPPSGTFIDRDALYGRRRNENPIKITFDGTVDWPLDTIVSAQNFVSWEEGRGRGVFKDKKASSEVIDDYAGRETNLPPIDMGLEVYLTDDGRIFAASNNSHRVAAAKKRGQPTIGVKNDISVYLLDSVPRGLELEPTAEKQKNGYILRLGLVSKP